MTVRALLAGLFIVGQVWVALGADENARSRFQALLGRQGDIQKVEGRFLQTRYTKLLAKPLVSAGSFVLERPGRARWVVENPEALILEVAEGALRGGPPGQLRDLDNSGAARGLGEMLELFLGSSERPLDGFLIEAGRSENTFLLSPRHPDAARGILKMEVTVDPLTGGPRTLVIYEPGEDRAEIRFMDVSVERAPVAEARP